MSRVRKPGKLRNPPKGRRYATVAGVIVLIALAGAGVYFYTGGNLAKLIPGAPTSTTSTQNATLTTSTGNGTSSSSGTSTATTAVNTAQPVYAIINTTQGVIEAQLYPSVAPKTVTNFVNLADSGFYNDLVWHRIVQGFVIQTGDPNTRNAGGNQATWGQGGSNTTVPLEVSSSVTNTVGTLAMARGSDPNSGSSQFFINLANNTSLNGQYTVFGKVISGMNVVQAIGNLPVGASCQSSGGLTCIPVNPQDAMVYSITIQNTP